jgi:hypothetical protein
VLLLIFAKISDAAMNSSLWRDPLLGFSQLTESKPFIADRIEIENPGVLIPGLSLDDLPRGISRLRNRVISRVFRELGLIEQSLVKSLTAVYHGRVKYPDQRTA